ncbi:hypothetical protein RchiOBHm_Chr5g0070161 [Rosa chinensis]|uniref:Uncharacterized protein n=1 Tax=Rosa chinensis TaxID=74649 RepID=A0A2P6QK38_ROSCH|nr:hypothetical protein RchiOBHm_Chr5g0070161 [Rosa chinensis]
MGVDFNSNWRMRHLLVFPIKGRASLLCSIPLLLHAESEIAPLCREIGLIIWRGNWMSDWCAVLTQPNSISDLVDHEALLPILQRSQRRIKNNF